MIAGIAGLWADVDYAGENHTKAGLPTTEAEALELIYAMPVPPTIVVHSGHGLQAWWLFDKPWIFEDDVSREEAQAMIRGWQGHMAQIAKDRGGWVVDATHDLSRLMRLPGTFNNKSEPVPVKVLSSDGPRHKLDDYWAYGLENGAAPIEKRETGLQLDTGAEPPWEQFRALRDNDPKFKRSLERRRSDLTDQSASSYDMSLASIAVVAGWSDQDIANLLIFSRRSNGDDLKLREDYYTRTISKARGPVEQAEAQERLEEGGSLADLSILLGVEIIDLVKHLGDPPEYWMETTDGSITLGTINNIVDQGRFRNAVAATTGRVLVRCKEAAWARRAESILSCCREVELGEASHPGSEMAHWVETYLDSQTVLEDQGIAAEQGLPFRKDGAVMFSLSEFRQYLRFSLGEQLSSHKLGQRLRLCGIEPTVVRVVVKGTETSRNYWGKNE
tara:strand:+ start:878 stop:2215 length:1338 start_codon:yes stop_codon:yes gene_type:complete